MQDKFGHILLDTMFLLYTMASGYTITDWIPEAGDIMN
jgi:hypothetical protein